MPRKTGLGKGLDALIPTGEGSPSQDVTNTVFEIPVDHIKPNPRQPRVHFDPEQLTELANSIRDHGIIQPLIVTKDHITGEYTLIAGERRLMAAREANLEKVPVILRESSDQERLELALIENLQREDLSPLETAHAYHQLAEDFGLTHEAIGKRVGKSRTSVTNTLRLLNLPPKVQQALTDGQISEGHARALLGLPTPQGQVAALQTILGHELNVRQTENLVRKLMGEKPTPPQKRKPLPEIQALEERLRSRLGTKVSLKHGAKGGSITIHYYSEEELDSLLQLLLGTSEEP